MLKKFVVPVTCMVSSYVEVEAVDEDGAAHEAMGVDIDSLPNPEYVTTLLIALFINKIIKITITNKLTPNSISKTYSLSINPSTYGFVFGNN